MQTPQAGCVARGGSQDPRGSRQRERLSGESLTISFEVLWNES